MASTTVDYVLGRFRVHGWRQRLCSRALTDWKITSATLQVGKALLLTQWDRTVDFCTDMTLLQMRH